VKTTVRKCPHCEKARKWSLLGSFDEESRVEEEDVTFYRTWRLLQCPACEKAILEEITYLEGDADPDEKILYPSAKASPAITPPIIHSEISDEVPSEISSEYESALKIRDISPPACAVLIRRTLEVICQYEKATGKDLNAKIHALAASRRIPQTLADMANLTRQIGNLGAHVDPNDKVTRSDVTTMIDFLEAILEYLYVAPAKIAAVQKRLSKTQGPTP
jgi:ribosomal protein S15P/S13E